MRALLQPDEQEGRKDLPIIPEGMGLSPGAEARETGQCDQTWPTHNSPRVALALQDQCPQIWGSLDMVRVAQRGNKLRAAS